MKNIKNLRGSTRENINIDLLKLLFAILVVGIHTEPFGNYIWLDRTYGIVTRLCVPFFFTIGSYFFFRNKVSVTKYLKKITKIYIVWSLIYLPFDIAELSGMKILDILKRFFWYGNEHALWYLCGTLIGTAIVYGLFKLLKNNKIVFSICLLLFIIGVLGSTWAPFINRYFGDELCKIVSVIGARTGLLYSAVYVALGKMIADNELSNCNAKYYLYGFIISIALLCIECVIFILKFHTQQTILWMSVLPAIYFLVELVINYKKTWNMSVENAVFIRKLSTLIYVSHNLFIIAFSGSISNFSLFIAVTVCTIALSVCIIKLENKFKVLKNVI